MVTYPHRRNGNNTMMPQCMSGYLDKDVLYGTYIKTDAHALAYKWRRDTGVLETIDLSTVASNQLELPLIAPNDSHYGLVLGATEQDKLYIPGNHHDQSDDPIPTKAHFIRCDDVDDFENPASWSAASTAHWATTSEFDEGPPGTQHSGLGLCYHLMERLSNGTLIHMMSQSENAGLGSRGRDYLAWKNVAGAWVPLITGGDGHFAVTQATFPQGVNADRVYITTLQVQKNGNASRTGDRIHAQGIWRTLNEDPVNSQKRPFYIYSDDLGTVWKAADGTTMTMPLTWANFTAAEVNDAPDYSVSVRPGLIIDEDTNYPSFIIGVESTSDLREYSFNGVDWDWTPYAPPVGGYLHRFMINGEVWVRFESGRRQGLYNEATGVRIYMGGAINMDSPLGAFDTYGANNPDPIWLRDDGILAMCIGEGNTPKIVTFGNNAQIRR